MQPGLKKRLDPLSLPSKVCELVSTKCPQTFEVILSHQFPQQPCSFTMLSGRLSGKACRLLLHGLCGLLDPQEREAADFQTVAAA